jgi:hypothetical protein
MNYEKIMCQSSYLCVEPNMFIAAPFKNGAGGEFVCLVMTRRHNLSQPLLSKNRDITNVEWERIERMPYLCWYTLWHGYTPDLKPNSWMVLRGIYTDTAAAGKPTRGSIGKTGV